MKKFLKIISSIIILTMFVGLAFNLYSTSKVIQIDKELTNVKYGKLSFGPVKYRSIIRLYNKDNKFFCSAVVIDVNYALTAAHCVINGYSNMKHEEINVYDDLNINTQVKVLPAAVDLGRDIALLRGDFNEFQHEEPNFSGNGQDILPKKVVMQCGYPGGGDLYCSYGFSVSQYIFRIVVNGSQLYKGMSGGPVFDAQSSTVVGVNSAATSNGTLYGPIIGADALFGIKE